MRISKTVEFDAGHRISNHPGKCKNPHGHRYRVEVTVSGSVDPETGMVIDFGHLRSAMGRVIEAPFDHAFIFGPGDRALAELFTINGWKHVELDSEPTAETLAALFARKITRELADFGATGTVTEVTVHETPTSWARWTIGE